MGNHSKQHVRAHVRMQRAQRLAETDRDQFADLFTAQLIAITKQTGAKRVSCFVSVGSEPNTSGFLDWAREHEVEVLLPRSRAHEKLEWALQGALPLVPGAFGIPEPTGAALPLESADLVLAPAAAVSRDGTRLGWGRGYFDRALGAIRTHRLGDRVPVYAVTFADEIFDSLPTEPHDVPVDGAITELQCLSFG